MKIEWNWDSVWDIHWKTATITKTTKKTGRRYYTYEVDTIMAFDTETSTGYFDEDNRCYPYSHEWYKANREKADGMRKYSLLYLWQVAIEDNDTIRVYMGRTLKEFDEFLATVSAAIACQSNRVTARSVDEANAMLKLTKKVRMPDWHMYIHNMPYDFQFLRNQYETQFLGSGGKVFARTMRKPLRCSMRMGYTYGTFHDTLCLTQKSLKAWAKDAKLPVQKKDEPKEFYHPIRTPETPLNEEELEYSYQDVVAMVYGLKQYREKYNHLCNIPMTQTGEVRGRCVEAAHLDEEWSKLCREATAKYNFTTFHRLCEAYCGGWTHANARYTGMHITSDEMGIVVCFDFASSYPAVMATRRYPVGPMEASTPEEWYAMAKLDVNDRPLMGFARVKVWGVKAKLDNTFWSASKIRQVGKKSTGKGVVEDNGRIYSADYFEAEMCDLDYDVFTKAYDYDKIEVEEVRLARAGYLPKVLVNLILDYYGKKTKLKGNEELLSMYAESKQFVNSIYGCAVTKIITDAIRFAGGSSPWARLPITETEFEEKIEEEQQKTMFLSYQIGVWVAAWARHNLWDAILQFDRKVVYCDTDSVKGFFNARDLEWFDEYNAQVTGLCEDTAKRYGFNPELFRPKTPDTTLEDGTVKPGKPKPLGVFAREEDAVEFKTLGAKRYMMRVWSDKKQKYVNEVTIAGLPKSAGEFLADFDDFADRKFWDVDEAAKTIMQYNDDQPEGLTFIDRDGNKYTTGKENRFGIAAIPTTFTMKMSDDYDKFLDMLTGTFVDDDDRTVIFRDCGRG